MNQFPPSPWVYHQGRFEFFSKIRGDIRRWKWKKSSIIKVLIISFGHRWEVEFTYRYIFAFKFTLRSQQPDIVPIICHRYQQFNTGVTGGNVCHWCQQHRGCCWYRWCTLTCEYETFLMGYSGAGGQLIHEKNQKQKIPWHCLFKTFSAISSDPVLLSKIPSIL